MAKSMRCKREKRLRSIRREIVEKEPFYTNKEAAKLAAQAAALAAPKLPVPVPAKSNSAMELISNTTEQPQLAADAAMDVDMADGNRMAQFLKPSSRKIGKKMRKKLKIAKKKNHGKGKIRRTHV